MNKIILTTVVLFISIITYSQDSIITFENTLKTSKSSILEAIPVVNEFNGNTLLFLLDSKRIYSYLFNSEFEIIENLASDKREKKYKKLIGKTIIDEQGYRFYFSNDHFEKFATINFSFEKKSSVYTELDLDLKGEKFIESIVYKNKFYLISVTKRKSTINFYSFDDDGNYTKNIIDLSKEKFYNKYWKEVSLYKTMLDEKEKTGFMKNYRSMSLSKIDDSNPNSIESTAEESKLYIRENNIVFSFDQNREYTQILELNIENFNYNVRKIIKPLSTTDGPKRSNSYINGDYYFAMASTNEEFSFHIHNYETGKLIKKYSATVDKIIPFKNSKIIQSGGWAKEEDDYREFDKTKKFLRKITDAVLGISVYELNGNYQIILGAKDENYFGSSGMIMVGGGGSTIGSFGNLTVSIYFDPTMYAYSSYSNTKTTYINCLFDKDFNHIKGNFGENVFDKINIYKEEINNQFNPIKVETVFKYKDYYIFGYYLDNKLNLLKFTDKE